MRKEPFIKLEPANKIAFIGEELLITLGKYLSIFSYENKELRVKKDCKKDLKIPYASEIDITDDGTFIALKNSQGLIKIFDSKTFEVISETTSRESPVKFSADGKQLIELELSVNTRETELYKRDIATLSILESKIFKGCAVSNITQNNSRNRFALKISPFPKDTFREPEENYIEIYTGFNISEPDFTIKLKTSHCRKIWLGPSGKFLAYSYMENSDTDKLVVLNVESGEMAMEYSMKRLVVGYLHVSWSEDEKYIGLAKDENIELWDFSEKTILKTLNEAGCYYLAFSPSGKYLALGFGAKTGRLYNMNDIISYNE